MNVATIGQPERSWASAGYAAEYSRGVRLYRRAVWRMKFLEASLAPGATVAFPVFLFPRPVFVLRMIGFTKSATTLDAASLEWGISDVSDRPVDDSGSGQVVTDGRFNRTAPVLAMVGRKFDWLLMDRSQPHNSKWQWTLSNTGAVPVFPIFLLDVETAIEDERPAVAT